MKKITLLTIKTVIFGTFAYIAWLYFDGPAFVDGWRALAAAPGWLAVMLAAYSAAFLCKAASWRLYLPEAGRPTLALCWHGLIYSLLLNHILPVKAGDAARVGVLWRHGTPAALALHSVVAMRALDMAALLALAAAGAPFLLGAGAIGPVHAAACVAVAAAAALALPLARRLPWRAVRTHADIAAGAMRGARGAAIAALTLAGWLLEAAVIHAVAAAVTPHAKLHELEAIWANAFTIAGGLLYAGPGGIGGYESAMSFALTRTGLTWTDALNVALISHSFKFIYSYATGLITWLTLPMGMNDWKQWRGHHRRQHEVNPEGAGLAVNMDKTKGVTSFEKTAARAWNFLNEGKPFLPIFVAGIFVLYHLPEWGHLPFWGNAFLSFAVILPILVLYIYYDFPLYLRNYLWIPVVALLLLYGNEGFDLRLSFFALAMYSFFTVFFWGTIYYRIRIGTPWNNFARFWKLVLKHSDSTSGNAQEQIPKFVLLLALWEFHFGKMSQSNWHIGADGGLVLAFTAGTAVFAWVLHRCLFDWKPKEYGWFTREKYDVPAEPIAKRVYVIVIDGMRKERFYEAETPFLDKLRSEGTEYSQMETIYPARTVVCFSSMHTGAYPREHGIASNLVLRYGVKTESVFDALRRAGRKGRLLGIAHLIDAFGDDVESITAVMKHDEADRHIIERAKKVVAEQDPDFLTVQLIGTDQTGHSRGVFYDDYIEKIQEEDALIEEFVGWLEERGKLEEAVLMFCADHGQADGIGGHGHLDDGERYVPFFVWGHGVAKGRRVDAKRSLVSLASTITYLLGAPFPSHAHGPVLTEPFERGSGR